MQEHVLINFSEAHTYSFICGNVYGSKPVTAITLYDTNVSQQKGSDIASGNQTAVGQEHCVPFTTRGSVLTLPLSRPNAPVHPPWFPLQWSRYYGRCTGDGDRFFAVRPRVIQRKRRKSRSLFRKTMT